MGHALRMLLLSICLASVSSAWAGPPDLLVGLHIQATQMELQYSSSVRKTDFSRLDLLWREPLNEWMDGSVKLGYIDLTQDSNPIPTGQSTSGNTVGLGLQFHLYRGDRLKLHVDVDYQYADTSADLSGQQVDIRWHQLSGQVGADFRFIQYSYLSLAVGSVAIDGEERATGTVTSTLTFQSHKTGYARLGILLGVDPVSHIGIEVSSGAISGGRIFFQRWF
jgi:hypothetical protein